MTVATSITVRVPLTIRRRPGRKTVVTPVPRGASGAVLTRADPALVKALARAFRPFGPRAGMVRFAPKADVGSKPLSGLSPRLR